MCPHARHRECGNYHTTQHLLSDGRKLLLRRLLQARGDRVCLVAADRKCRRRRLRIRSGAHLGHGVSRRRRRHRIVERDRGNTRRAHSTSRNGRQLLVHGHSRSVWSMLGDLLRPRARVRARRWPGGRRGPVHRDLESRVHAERARPGVRQGRFRNPRTVAQAEHRHRHGRRACRLPAAGRRQRLRNRSGAPGHRQGGGAQRSAVRRRSCGRYPVPCHRRSRTHSGAADLGRREPRQRRPRLCAATIAASNRPLRAPARCTGSDHGGADHRRSRHDGRVLPRTRHRIRPHPFGLGR